jgi:hypothetical protein
MGVGIGVVAEGPEILLAEQAASARDGERDDHAITALELLDLAADFLDDPHELVAEDIARLHGGDVAIVEVQVAAADGCPRDADDRIAGIDNLRIPDRVYLNFFGTHPANCLHRISPWRTGRALLPAK